MFDRFIDLSAHEERAAEIVLCLGAPRHGLRDQAIPVGGLHRAVGLGESEPENRHHERRPFQDVYYRRRTSLPAWCLAAQLTGGRSIRLQADRGSRSAESE